MKTVSVIGGGIGGLLAAIQLAEAGIPCTLFERKSYPFHRVCGEYISNEVVPFLESMKLYPTSQDPVPISKFMLSSVAGTSVEIPLGLGGFGISRYAFDHFLYQKAVAAGVTVFLNTAVESVAFSDNSFTITTPQKQYESDIVIAAYGKRSGLDVKLQRGFIRKRSPYLGVKYHVRYEHPSNLVALHNFPGGYCGINSVENNIVNLCYLVRRERLKASGSIPEMEEKVLFRNPLLKEIFSNAEFVFQKPETINEVSFETKAPVENHLLMVGDSAGMITPLCGNGMAMAMHASLIASRVVKRFCFDSTYPRSQMEQDYINQWKRAFQFRLWMGRQIQSLFGSERASTWSVMLMRNTLLAKAIVKNTHGQPFR